MMKSIKYLYCLLITASFIGDGVWVKFSILPILDVSEYSQIISARLGWLPQHEYDAIADAEIPERFMSITDRRFAGMIRNNIEKALWPSSTKEKHSNIRLTINRNRGDRNIYESSSVDQYMVDLDGPFTSDIIIHHSNNEAKGLFIIRGGHRELP
jgi:hypothetical protein